MMWSKSFVCLLLTFGTLLGSLIGSNGSTLWFQHPFNTASEVPFFNENPTGTIDGYLMASASIVTKLANSYYSFKIPTDRPMQRKGVNSNETVGR